MKKLGYSNLMSLTTPGDLEDRVYPYWRVSRRLCGFELRGQEWVAEPQALFRPSALMLWDVPERALVSPLHRGPAGADPDLGRSRAGEVLSDGALL